MLKVGFVVTPEFPVMSLAALSVFEFANLRSPAPLYDVQILSEHGGPIAASLGATVETLPFRDTRFDTLIIGGNVRFVPTSPALQAFITDTGPGVVPGQLDLVHDHHRGWGEGQRGRPGRL